MQSDQFECIDGDSDRYKSLISPQKKQNKHKRRHIDIVTSNSRMIYLLKRSEAQILTVRIIHREETSSRVT